MGSLPRPHKWEEWLAWETAIDATYRESPQPMAADPDGQVDAQHPPQTVAGMSRTVVDGNGRLLEYSAVPDSGRPGLDQPVTPEAIFRAAKLDMAGFTETKPQRTPTYAFDQWRAWKGPHPFLPNTELQLEAAWWKGRVTRVWVLYPWDRKGDEAAVSGADFRGIGIAIMLGIAAFFVLLLARRNWIRGRADRAGAFRVGMAIFLFQAIASIGVFHPVASMQIFDPLLIALAECLMWATILGFAYLALEPEIRSRWPHSIVTWNRVLAGRWMDAQVGWHVLIGGSVGAGFWVFFKAVTIFIFRNNEPRNWDVALTAFLGPRAWLGTHASNAAGALSTGLFIFLTIFGMRQLLRNEVLAAVGAAAIFTLAQGEVRGSDWWLIGLLYMTVISALIFVLLRFGLVATIAMVFYLNALNAMALGTDWHAWYIPASLATLLMLAGIAVVAFWRSLGDLELLGEGR